MSEEEGDKGRTGPGKGWGFARALEDIGISTDVGGSTDVGVASGVGRSTDVGGSTVWRAGREGANELRIEEGAWELKGGDLKDDQLLIEERVSDWLLGIVGVAWEELGVLSAEDCIICSLRATNSFRNASTVALHSQQIAVNKQTYKQQQ